MSTYRVGIDIGGTFTDAAFVDEQSGAVQIIKVPSTPADPSSGFMAAVERGLQRCDVGGEAVRLVVHATTVATNALIEGKTASLGMMTTQGFRDILEIGRQIRARLYDVHLTNCAWDYAAPWLCLVRSVTARVDSRRAQSWTGCVYAGTT